MSRRGDGQKRNNRCDGSDGCTAQEHEPLAEFYRQAKGGRPDGYTKEPHRSIEACDCAPPVTCGSAGDERIDGR